MEPNPNVNVRFYMSAFSSREHGHRRVVAGDAGHAAAALRARPAHHNVVVRRLHAPLADLVLLLGERPREVAVEDVPTGQAELGLELERRPRLQARLPR